MQEIGDDGMLLSPFGVHQEWATRMDFPFNLPYFLGSIVGMSSYFSISEVKCVVKGLMFLFLSLGVIKCCHLKMDTVSFSIK